MGVRIASAIVCIVLAALFALTFLPDFGPPWPVRPTGGVVYGQMDDLPTLQQSAKALQARTFLEHWRAVSDPQEGATFKVAVKAPNGNAAPNPASKEER